MNNKLFDEIKKVNEFNNEYWSARELSKVLAYSSYRNFLIVIKKAKEACKNSNQVIHNHFVVVNKMVQTGSGAKRKIKTIHLSRYACYLIVQNADPSKEVVAMGQTYFAIQTRRQEQRDDLIEDGKRVMLRGEMKKHNSSLAEAASQVGVKNHGKFQNFGYKGLYDGLDVKEIHQKKELKKSQKILDHMGSEELAANLFRATQTDAKLRRENVVGENEANLTHYDVGKKVRKTIQELGGTMPEELPTAEDVKKVERRLKSDEKKILDV